MLIRLAINMVLRLWIKPLWSKTSGIDKVRRTLAWADRCGSIGRAAPAVKQDRVDGVDIEWIGAVDNASRGVIVYLHGGSFSVRAPLTDRRFCADLSRRTGLSVVLIAYRLAPEFPFPAGLDDCCRVYEHLLQSGVPSERIVLLGHSAGANLALVLMMRIQRQNFPQPAGAVLLSPVTDFTARGASVTDNAKRDVFMTPAIWSWSAATYLADVPLTDPEVSPLFGDWRGLPQLAFHVSESEMLLDDSRRAVARAQASGTHAQITLWKGVPHNFAFIDFLAEAASCRDQIAGFVRHCLDS